MRTIAELTQAEARAAMERHTHRTFMNRPYFPVRPSADNPDVCDFCDRLMLVHGGIGDPEPKLKVAQCGTLTAGWVVGVMPAIHQPVTQRDRELVISEANAVECSHLLWTAEAAELGIKPGQKLPQQIKTTLGNGQDFYFRGSIHGGAVGAYVQALGCITLHVLND